MAKETKAKDVMVKDVVVKERAFKMTNRMDQLQADLLAIAIPSLIIVIAEMALFAGMTKFAVWTHLILLVLLTLATMMFNDSNKPFIFHAFILLSLIRVLNLLTPVFFEITLYSYVFTYAPLAIPLYVFIKDHGLKLADIGINRNIRYYDLPIVLVASIVIAVGEFLIIEPDYLIPDLSPLNLIALSIIMIFFVGLFEELIFRSILQTKLEEMIGKHQALILASILFGIMHSGYGTPYEIVFTGFAGLILGKMYMIRRNLLLVTLTHGSVNILLFGILPYVLS